MTANAKSLETVMVEVELSKAMFHLMRSIGRWSCVIQAKESGIDLKIVVFADSEFGLHPEASAAEVANIAWAKFLAISQAAGGQTLAPELREGMNYIEDYNANH